MKNFRYLKHTLERAGALSAFSANFLKDVVKEAEAALTGYGLVESKDVVVSIYPTTEPGGGL